MSHKLSLLVGILLVSLLACSSTQDFATQGGKQVQSGSIQTQLAETADSQLGQPTQALLGPTRTLGPIQTATLVPSRLKIVYILDGNVQLWHSGASVALTSSADAVAVSISPDGQVVAYTRQVSDKQSELWAVNPDGSNNHVLVSADELNALVVGQVNSPHDMQWVPGTHTLAYSTSYAIDGPGLPLNQDIQWVNADTRAQSTFVPAGQGGSFYYSPDGSKVLLVKPESISIIDSAGSNRHELLSYPSANTYSEWFYTPQPVWSPDSTFFWVVIPPQDPLADPAAKATLWKVMADGSGTTALSTFLCVPIFQNVPTISPAGNHLAYVHPTGGEVTELHMASLDLTVDDVLNSGKNGFVGWSPDSQRFIYWVDDPVKWLVGQVNGEAIPVEHAVHPGSLRWVDPDHFLFTNSGEAPELWLVQVGGPSQLIGSGTKPIAYDFSH